MALDTGGLAISTIGTTGSIYSYISKRCQCLWFFPPDSPLLDQDICSLCGHGIHAHADYVSMVVNHYPANQCAVYAQKTCLTQRCTCEAQFCEHIATDNSYRLPEPWTVLDYFNPDINRPSSSLALTSSYSSNVNGPFSPSTSSSNYTTVLSGDARNISLTPASASSPSSASASSAIQPDTAQTLDYSSDSHFTQYPDHFVNLPYAGLPEGHSTNKTFEHQDHGNAMHAELSGAWLGSYGA
ncbi:hypothetical protein EV421DRAFT_1902504 [Armillaria borealis]|uniref:Uncharacterized protein n=1 Tax=Armillaria borealis TaxID=47425 RepID=A0AA39JPR2_9AGAR|nr:hypothetical protein EV421DRAFT_1902504 [Armillaria borealis]